MQVVQQRDFRNLGYHLLYNLNPFTCNFWGIEKYPGDISPGRIEALHGSNSYGVGFKIERYYWNCLRRMARSLKTSRCDSKNYVHMIDHQFNRQLAKQLTLAL